MGSFGCFRGDIGTSRLSLHCPPPRGSGVRQVSGGTNDALGGPGVSKLLRRPCFSTRVARCVPGPRRGRSPLTIRDSPNETGTSKWLTQLIGASSRVLRNGIKAAYCPQLGRGVAAGRGTPDLSPTTMWVITPLWARSISVRVEVPQEKKKSCGLKEKRKKRNTAKQKKNKAPVVINSADYST